MQLKSLVCAALLLASPLAFATNTFNLKCPVSAQVGATGTPPSGWTNAPADTILSSGAYMPNSTMMGCTYPSINTKTATLTKTMGGGVTCSVAGGQTFSCSNGSTVSCPASAVADFAAPIPTGWASGFAGMTNVFQNSVSGGGTVLSCDYKGYGGVLFKASPVGATCTGSYADKWFNCTTPFVSGGSPVSNILTVLDSSTMSWLSSKIVFTNGDGTAYPYSSWNSTDRARFLDLYQDLVAGIPISVSCPNLGTQMAGRKLYYFRAQALDMFMAQVAHMFYIESTERVPWSFLGFSDLMLTDMLGSKNLFSTIQPSNNASYTYPTGIVIQTDFQSPFRTDAEAAPSYVCDPTIGYRLMTGVGTTAHANLIGADREETLKNLSVWFAENVGHGGTPTLASSVALLEDRLTEHDPGTGYGVVASNGCHGATNLFYDIARSVNLPVVPAAMVSQKLSYPVPPSVVSSFMNFTHGSMVFAPGESGNERVMEHTDDMYAMGNRTWGAGVSNVEDVFFDSVWRSSSDMTAMGFPAQSSLPWVITGTGWGAYQRTGGFEDRPDFGQFLGVWEPDGSDEFAYSSAYYADQGYQLCRWQLYLSEYCSTTPPGTSWSWLVAPPSTGPFHTVSEHNTRAAACISAAGGCSAAQAAAASFYANDWGRDVVVTP